MKFLDQVFLDNTIRSYIITAVIIVIAYILKRIVSKYATALIFRLGKNQWRGMTKKEFDDIIISPLEKILIVIVIIVAFDELHFPNALRFKIHTISSEDIVNAVASAAIIICIVSLLIRFIEFLVLVVQHKSEKNQTAGRKQILFFFKDLIRVVLIIFGILFILKYSFNVDIGNVLTGLSIVGAALALAAKESLENLIASFVIFFDKPFETGDYVKVNNIAGNIERIGLRSTRVRTSASSLVTIPNKQMVDSILDNWSERNTVRNVLKSYMSPETRADSLSLAVTKIKEMLNADEKITSCEVHLAEVNNISATILVVFYTSIAIPYVDNNDIIQQVNIRIRGIQEELGIKPADSSNLTVKNS